METRRRKEGQEEVREEVRVEVREEVREETAAAAAVLELRRSRLPLAGSSAAGIRAESEGGRGVMPPPSPLLPPGEGGG